MPKPKKKITIDYDTVNRCIKCGVELDEDNTLITPSNTTGLGCMCYECQQKMFDRIAATQGKALATYMTACMLDVPLKPIVLEGVEDEFNASNESWLFYLQRLEESGEGVNGNKVLGFADGEQYLLRIFGASFTERDFAKYIYHERQRIEEAEKKRAEEEKRKIGSPIQREKWGTQSIYKGLEMTQAVYDELDRQYELRAKEFKGQTLSLQQEDALMEVAKLKVIRAFLLMQGKPKAANDMQKDIDLLLAGEQMRKKDEKISENYSFDSQVVALEKAGVMENGDMLTTPEVQKALFDRFIRKKDKFSYSLDIVDECLERIWNTMRANADLFISTELPDTLEVEDKWGEMAQEKSEAEKENERFTGAVKITFAKNDKKDGTN